MSQPEETTDSAIVDVEPIEAGEEVKPKRTVWYYLFSPETRVGRFMRPFLRMAALVIGVFALGVLAAYILLYQPAARQLATARADLAAAQEQVDEQQAALDEAKASLDTLQGQYDTLQAELDVTESRLGIARAVRAVAQARYALAARDSVGAERALKEARAELDELMPVIEAHDPDVAESVDLRLNLISTEIKRDARTAQSDMEILSSMLLLFDDVLVKQ